MKNQKKTPSGCNRKGANKIVQNQNTKLPSQPQEPTLWRAHVTCVERYTNSPTLMNKVIAEAVASAWNASFKSEVCHAE